MRTLRRQCRSPSLAPRANPVVEPFLNLAVLDEDVALRGRMNSRSRCVFDKASLRHFLPPTIAASNSGASVAWGFPSHSQSSVSETLNHLFPRHIGGGAKILALGERGGRSAN